LSAPASIRQERGFVKANKEGTISDPVIEFYDLAEQEETWKSLDLLA
jgi:hypothetical protein